MERAGRRWATARLRPLIADAGSSGPATILSFRPTDIRVGGSRRGVAEVEAADPGGGGSQAVENGHARPTSTAARRRSAAATMWSSAGRTSFQPRVFRPQSGLTQSRSRPTRRSASSSSASISSIDGHPRRVDVVDAGADLVRVGDAVGEGVEQLHVRARGLDRDHVGVESDDVLDDVVELRVTHVGVDLGLGPRRRGRQAEAVDRPAQVGVAVGEPQRQALAQRRLVDLDDRRPGRLEVEHLVPDRQGDLGAGLAARLVVADEGPLQDRHRPGQHALHRLLGQRLRVAPPVDGHRRRPRDVAEEDRRLHAAGAVGLHPAVRREGEAGELLAEVLDHVVALGLAVDEHVEADLLLEGDHLVDLAADELVVGGLVELAFAQLAAGGADRVGLRVGADRRGRQLGQAEALRLQRPPLAEGRGPLVVASPRGRRPARGPPGRWCGWRCAGRRSPRGRRPAARSRLGGRLGGRPQHRQLARASPRRRRARGGSRGRCPVSRAAS